ncbi:hypothetical protein [Streptacidiphilus sp. EB129]|uniref:hypothetical protein n=1 Tax=Streptacidiphilus sp. EB129 TaxID=3156262 RepID=UPI003514414A
MTMPDGTTVTKLPGNCIPDTMDGTTRPGVYDCGIPYWEAPGAQHLFTFSVRIDKKIANDRGTVALTNEGSVINRLGLADQRHWHAREDRRRQQRAAHRRRWCGGLGVGRRRRPHRPPSQVQQPQLRSSLSPGQRARPLSAALTRACECMRRSCPIACIGQDRRVRPWRY